MGRPEFFPQSALPEARAQIIPETQKKQILKIIVSGPTGVGKDKAISGLSIPQQKIVTHTTRYRGTNEIDGVDYHFTTKKDFERMIKQGEIPEFYLNPRGDYYGTSKKEIENKKDKMPIVWRLNPEGVFNLIDDPVKRNFLEPAVIIFLIADLDVLAKRVRERGREKGLLVVERTKQASQELFLIERKIEAREESEEIAKRVGAIYDESLFFHNGNGWVDDPTLTPDSRIALRLIENRQGLDHPDGFPRTIKLVEETIMEIKNLWGIS